MNPDYLATVRLFAGNFAPKGWAFCDGSLLSISQNSALFSLLGTTYGGNGQTTFGLPDLRGRVAVGAGSGPGLSNYYLGYMGGEASVILVQDNLPSHTHNVAANNTAGTTNVANGNYLAVPNKVSGRGTANTNAYSSNTSTLTPLSAAAVSNTGGSQPHDNLQPYVGLNYIICINGSYPSRN